MYLIDFSTIYGGEDNLLTPCSEYSIRIIKLVSPQILANRQAIRAIMGARLKTTIVSVIITSFLFFSSQVIWSTIGLDIKIRDLIPEQWVAPGRGPQKPVSRWKTFFTFENLLFVGATLAVNVVLGNILTLGIQSIFQSFWGPNEARRGVPYGTYMQVVVLSERALRFLQRMFGPN